MFKLSLSDSASLLSGSAWFYRTLCKYVLHIISVFQDGSMLYWQAITKYEYNFMIMQFPVGKNKEEYFKYSLGEAGGSIAARGGGGGPALRSRVYHASASPRWASLASRATSPPRPVTSPPPTTPPLPHWHHNVHVQNPHNLPAWHLITWGCYSIRYYSVGFQIKIILRLYRRL